MLANWVAACGHPAALERAPDLAAEVEARRLGAFAV
jgi:para-aminobenzoate synthetase component 2